MYFSDICILKFVCFFRSSYFSFLKYLSLLLVSCFDSYVLHYCRSFHLIRELMIRWFSSKTTTDHHNVNIDGKPYKRNFVFVENALRFVLHPLLCSFIRLSKRCQKFIMNCWAVAEGKWEELLVSMILKERPMFLVVLSVLARRFRNGLKFLTDVIVIL